MSVSVIGCGYLGAVHAAAMTLLGHDVVGVDVDADKIAKLSPCELPFHAADLTHVGAAVKEITAYLHPGDIVAGKSTVPVGSAERFA